MTADKFEATLGTKEPRIEALRRMRDIIMAMGDCADVLNQEERMEPREPYGRLYYQGKMDGFASCFALLETLGPQIEEEAHERGYEQGSQEAYDNPRKPSR